MAEAKVLPNDPKGPSAYDWRVVVGDRTIAYTLTEEEAIKKASEYNTGRQY